jgi:CheY-like chemotaxis protein
MVAGPAAYPSQCPAPGKPYRHGGCGAGCDVCPRAGNLILAVAVMGEEPQPSHELRILVVDDSLDAAHALAGVLELLGCRTAVAFGGTMALRIAQLFRPDVVILDLDLGAADGDGCDVLRTMRSDVEGADAIHFVCLTGCRDDGVEARCLAAGFDRFYAKPIEPAALAGVVDRQRAAEAGRQRPS